MHSSLVSIQRTLVRATELLILVLSTAFVLIVIYAVASRYIFGFSITWIEEIVRFLMVWIVFVGISVVAYERGHMSMDAIRERLPMTARRALDLASNLLIIFFLCIVFYHGLKLAVSAIPQVSPVSRVSYFWPYLSLPVGAALAIVQYVFLTADDISTLRQRHQSDNA